MRISCLLAIFKVAFFMLCRVKRSTSQPLTCQQPELPRDCAEVRNRCSGTALSGVYPIKPDSLDAPFDVYCDQDDDDGGWTILQRRSVGQTDFNRSWSEFKKGFGFLNGEFWLGNDKLAYMTNQKNYQLRIDMATSNGSSFSVTYDMFRIGDEWSEYKLHSLGRYNGSADFQLCPNNMVLNNCSCQASCTQPDACELKCMEENTCVCPEGFLLNGNDCVSPEECGCFEPEIGVIPEGGSISNSDCSEQCTCEANQLTCDVSYRCDNNAHCEERNNTRGCYCKSDYQGDGVTCRKPEETFSDCYDVYKSGLIDDGVYTIQPSGWPGSGFQVYCNMSNGGGWTVFQRRQDGSVDFYRDWAAYKAGFGTPTTEFWLGNDKLYYLTNQKHYEMRIDIVDSDGVDYNMNYDSFRTGNETDEYRLQILGNFTGNTGYDHMAYHRGMGFSTHDNDHDSDRYSCAPYYRGAWWYNTCYEANLNGVYSSTSSTGIALHKWGTGFFKYSLRYTEMKVRPI